MVIGGTTCQTLYASFNLLPERTKSNSALFMEEALKNRETFSLTLIKTWRGLEGKILMCGSFSTASFISPADASGNELGTFAKAMFAKKAKKNKAVKQAKTTFMFCGATGI